MGDVVNAVGMAASVASLLDVSARLMSKLDKIRSTGGSLDQTASQLTDHLQLLTIALYDIQKQAELSQTPIDILIAVSRVIQNTSAQGESLYEALAEFSSQRSTSGTLQLFGTMANSRLQHKCQEAMRKLSSNVEILTLYHQTTLSHNIKDVRNLLKQNLMNPNKGDTCMKAQTFGLVLRNAPILDSNSFVGRDTELAELHRCLSAQQKADAQCIVSLVGIGGVGKTQLSLAYARRYAHHFTSTFWLDAAGLVDARQSMARTWDCIGGDQSAHPPNEDLKAEKFRSWLAEPWNHQWLLIFDNHDNPRMPGDHSPGAYDLRSLLPSRAHGNILITTRSTKLAYSKRIFLKELESVDQAVDLMSHRAGRDMTTDE